MTKRKWLSLAIIIVCGAIVLSVFSILFQSSTGVALPWWAYPIALLIYALIVYLVVLLTKVFSQRFEVMLQRENFNVDKQYHWDKQALYVDYQSKRIANTYLSTKPLVRFDEIAGCRFETYQSGVQVDLPDDKRFVSFVITVKKEGFDYEYLYIPMFEVEVEATDIGDGITEITPELLGKYPELKNVSELHEEVKTILQNNEAEGIKSNVRKD